MFFRRVPIDGRIKGNVQFQGFGVVSSAQRITQFNHKTKQSFINYVFDFTVFDLSEENEEFNWHWISARRNAEISINETIRLAPDSWKTWIAKGPSAIEQCRRRVSKLLTYSALEQRPLKGTKEESALNTIYDYYTKTGKKYRFEALASYVAAEVIKKSGGDYHEGWITSMSSDGGADFIGRLDVGSDFSKAKIIVLGQAKCERLDYPTGGNHIARTIARLKRGWIGVYVTTSYFSEAVQREVIEDKYPVILINGLRLASEVLKIVHKGGYSNITDFIDEIDANYSSKVMTRNPEEILYI